MTSTILLVIIPDALSALVDKGEIAERYYNPGDLFTEVHILMVNADRPDIKSIQPMVGKAQLHLHNLPIPLGRFFHKTLGWRPMLMRSWARGAINLAKEIHPSLIRCHGADFNGFFAAEIKRTLGIPYVLSLHTHAAENRARWTFGWKQKIFSHAMRSVETIGIRNADAVLCVYESIVEYARTFHPNRLHTIYNIINGGNSIAPKTDYSLSNPAKLVSVGNLMPGKNPVNVIRALKDLNATLTLIGKGEKEGELRKAAQEAGVEHKVEFIPSMPNKEICSKLLEYDIFATHCEYDGIPKAVMEPLLAGLPVIINRRNGPQVPEYLNNNIVSLVDDSTEGYATALTALMQDMKKRKQLGINGRKNSMQLWNPEEMENKIVQLYKSIMRQDH